MLLWIGLLVLVAGTAVIVSLALSDPSRSADKAEERKLKKEKASKEDAALKELYANITRSLETKPDTKKKKRSAFSPENLELAEIEATPGSLVVWITVASFMGAIFGFFILKIFFVGLLLAALPYFGFKFVVKRKVKKKHKAFSVQLGQALQVISSSLSAGQSLMAAFSSVVEEAEEPIKSEINRILNEDRLGQDTVASLYTCAERMKSEDFEWFASSVALQRKTGGNLVEIIDTVTDTIRERSELREKIKAYSAEGRASAYILMSLPIVIGGLFNVMNPSYMKPLFTTPIGLALLALSTVMYFIGYFWMSKIVDVKM